MIQVNTILKTKDGRKVGNAIVTNINIPNRGNHRVVTDYGNLMNLTESEIIGLFHLGELATKEHKNYNPNSNS